MVVHRANRTKEMSSAASSRERPAHLHGQNMRDQLSCHISNAGFKDPWNLESWRPDVGYNKTVVALCNP